MLRVPEITARILDAAVEGIQVQRIRFSSFEGTTDGNVKTNEIYAVIARPAAAAVRSRPAVLIFHGGAGKVQEQMAIQWAKLGFVAISPELPGWVDGASMKSISRYSTLDGADWGAVPNARASTIFDSVVAGLGAFNFISSQRDVNPDKISMTGASLGGYLVTMLCGLLDVRVDRAFSLYGCGYFLETAWAGFLLNKTEAERKEWIRHLDAGSRIDRVRARCMYYAASNDTFFFPPAINKTFDAVPGEKYLCFSPNDNHIFNLPGGSADAAGIAWTTMERVFISSTLDSARRPLPKVYRGARTGQSVSIELAGVPPNADYWIYYSTNLNAAWTQRKWERLQPRATPVGFAADFDRSLEVTDWFADLSFDFKTIAVTNKVSLSTKVFQDDFSE